MRRMPPLVLLRSFEAAARLESFALAANELHLTPSAISHQVKDLEAYFARPLFVRKNRRVTLTPEGRRLQDSLGRVFDVIESACQEVSLTPQSQVLALHCAPSFAAKWLGPRLPGFMQLFPDITIRLTTGADLLDLTRSQELDVIISYGTKSERPGLHTVALGVEKIVPLCSPKLLRQGVSVREQICALTLIDSQLSDVTWKRWFDLNRLTLPDRPRPSFDRAALSISAAVDGVGVSLESSLLAQRELERGDLVELGQDEFEPLAQSIHFLTCRSNEKKRAKVKHFCEWLMQSLPPA